MSATNSERRKLHAEQAVTDAMRITTYECFAPTSPERSTLELFPVHLIWR